jgi:hypothetical protein
MSRSYLSSPQSASMACSGTAFTFTHTASLSVTFSLLSSKKSEVMRSQFRVSVPPITLNQISRFFKFSKKVVPLKVTYTVLRNPVALITPKWHVKTTEMDAKLAPISVGLRNVVR